jgi:hypothetical protein
MASGYTTCEGKGDKSSTPKPTVTKSSKVVGGGKKK